MPPQDSTGVQRPPQGFSNKGRVRRWVAFPNLKGCYVFVVAGPHQEPDAVPLVLRGAGTRLDAPLACARPLEPIRVRQRPG